MFVWASGPLEKTKKHNVHLDRQSTQNNRLYSNTQEVSSIILKTQEVQTTTYIMRSLTQGPRTLCYLRS